MITVHHLENSRSQRVLWLLEELGVEYEIERYERDPKTMLAPDSLTDVHPLGKSPVVEDGDTIVAESGAIIEYLVDRYDSGRLRPAPGTAGLLEYRYWLHYAEGSLMPWLLMKLVFGQLNKPPMPLVLRPVAGLIAAGIDAKLIGPRLKQHFRFIDSHLSENDWFAGPAMTAADIQMSFPLEAARQRTDLKRYPNIGAFVSRIHALDTYQRALERGGPYDYA